MNYLISVDEGYSRCIFKVIFIIELLYRWYDCIQNCPKRHLAFLAFEIYDITYKIENKSIEARDDDSHP